jgi:hypothetical protein
MPNARQVVDLFSHDELLAFVDERNLDIADGRPRNEE